MARTALLHHLNHQNAYPHGHLPQNEPRQLSRHLRQRSHNGNICPLRSKNLPANMLGLDLTLNSQRYN